MLANFSKAPAQTIKNGNDGYLRQWDWISVLLTWTLILTVTRRLLVTNWADELYLIAYIVNLAFLFGLALGYSRFRSRTILFLTVFYGIFLIGWRLGLLQNSVMLWGERISIIIIRISVIIQRLSNSQPVYDNLLFLLLMMVLFWLIGVNTSYSLVRSKNTLRIISPLFIALILIHTYDPLIPARNGYLYIFSFLAVLTIGRLFYIQQKVTWYKKQFYIPPQLSSDVLQFTIGWVIALLILSIILPSSRNQLETLVRAWNKIKEPFQSFRQDFENAFASLRVTTGNQPEFYERTLNLGRGNELSEEEIFTAIAQSKLPENVRIYWRSRVYDYYENGQWTLSTFSTREYEANAFDIEIPAFPDRSSRLQSFSIYLNQPFTTLVLPAQPYWINLAVQIEFVENSDQTIDLLAVLSKNPLPVGKTYNARSSLSLLTEEQLRRAGKDYPSWVTERYLQTPDSLTERTKALAQQITKDHATEYDQVVAITEYLRDHITHVETLEDLPANQDLIDWFLFDHRKGFCNYYATAEVLLLRSIGIPARLAVGFAEGTLEDIQDANVYIIRQKDAHAWPEVFFPNIGWVEFEPTSSQPALTRPQKLEKEELQSDSSTSAINPQDILKKLREENDEAQHLSPTDQNRFPLITLVFILVLISFLIWTTLNRQKVTQAYLKLPELLENRMRAVGLPPPKILIDWNQFTKLTSIEKSYQRINTALRVLGDSAPFYYTPFERASKLLKLLPEAEAEIQQLIQQYHNAQYGKCEFCNIETKKLDQTILRLALQKRLRDQFARLFNGKE